MDSYYLGDQIAEDHTHTSITTCNIEESQQKYRLRTVSNRLMGALNVFYYTQTLALRFCMGSKHLVRMKVS